MQRAARDKLPLLVVLSRLLQMLLLLLVMAVAATEKAASRFEQVSAQIVLALFASLMGRQSLVAQILRLLSVERKLGHCKAQSLPEHFVAPLNAGAVLEPHQQISVEVRNGWLAQHNYNQAMTVSVPKRLEMGSTEFVLHPLAIN